MFADATRSRRHFLSSAVGGLSTVALSWLLSRESRGAEVPSARPAPHYAPRAKRIVQVFCAGGVSHLETFDYKPELVRWMGNRWKAKARTSGSSASPET